MLGYYMPTTIYFGKNCVKQNGSAMATLGKRACLVTGGSSSKKNGSLKDMKEMLDSLGIAYTVFDKVESNPSVETVRNAAAVAKEFGAQFIIGIGGGSPLDAAKATAVLCTNTIEDEALFANAYERPLPVVAVPTTSGTGSEVTQYAVLTNKKVGTKMGISTRETFPVLAYVDPMYTMTVNKRTTIYTAIDALSHAVEGYLSRKASPLSDMWAEESMKMIGRHLATLGEPLTYEGREDLMYASLLAGVVIAQTGTTLVHGMGYPLTYYKGLDHGLANGVLFPAYMREMTKWESEKVDTVYALLKVRNHEEFTQQLEALLDYHGSLTDEEIKAYTTLTMPTNAVKNTVGTITPEVVQELYRASHH